MQRVNNNRVDLNLLTVFNAISQTRSVSAAAALLSLSQPAVSHALNRLRRMTGDPLFVRGGGGLLATPRALEMRQGAYETITCAQALLVPAQFNPGADARSFKIASSDYSSMTFLPALLRAVRQKAPHCAIELTPVGASTLKQLESGDLHGSFWGVEPPAPPLQSMLLFSDKLTGIVCVSHPLAERARQSNVTLGDYLAYPHATVSHNVSSGNQIDTALRALGLARQIRYIGQSFAGNLAAIDGTNLIAALPARLVPFAVRMGFVSFGLPLPLNRFPYYFVWHSRTQADAPLVWLRREIEAAGAQGQAGKRLSESHHAESRI